jgi:photosystem II stability/assembly factor-like uncharacterized protein
LRVLVPKTHKYLSADFVTPQIGAIAAGNTIMRTSNGGANWSEVAAPPADSIFDLVATNSTTFIAIGRQAYLYRSTDAGMTWSATAFPAHLQKLSASSPNLIMGITDEGTTDQVAYASVDGGVTWNITDPRTAGIDNTIHRYTALYYRYGIAYIGTTRNRVLRSSNGGLTWTLYKDLPTDSKINAFLFFDDVFGHAVGD